MSKAKQNIKYHYSSFSKRKQPFGTTLKGNWKNDNLLAFNTENAIEGWIYFTQVSEGFSVFLSNIKTQNPTIFTLKHKPSDQDIIISFDMNTQINNYFIKGIEYHIKNENLRFSITDSSMNKNFISNSDIGWNQIQLIISNEVYTKLIKELYHESYIHQIFDPRKNTIFHYGPIDNRSNLTLNQLKNCCHLQPEFNLKLKSHAFSLFGNIIVLLTETKLSLKKIHPLDTENIMKSRQYIVERLTGKFPSIHDLASISQMSYSKYISLFKKIFKMTPYNFFQNEKMSLAQTLLKSGNFNSVTDIAYHLNFSNRRCFSEAYKKHFNELPFKLFVKK
ncbi:helix-turn-helix domain-containing protein [Flavobacterium sp. '19STA2R22 D10 B1']|uniref:helix-turn-helix domain-containing protein n=1 Tax=Flavobacterium aerium TaxID=3037261 RepID=UPI00278BE20B|nr:AraC family transcriptional regulator [Flavobacterium sp. '19STA2R22 D10 B1']